MVVETTQKSLLYNFCLRQEKILLFPRGKLTVQENQSIIKFLWEVGINNANLMYRENGVINMTTYLPFRDGLCSNTDEISVDVYKNGSFVNGDVDRLFPKGKDNEIRDF